MNLRAQTKKRLYNVFLWGMTVVIAFVILFPLYWIFISSVTPKSKLFSTPIDYFPNPVTWEYYVQLFEDCKLGGKLVNTLVITAAALVLNTAICTLAAYGFCRNSSKGLTLAYSLIILSMMVPMVVKARPLFTFLRACKLLDTYWGLILLYTSNLIPFAMVILGNFMRSVPHSIDEAAEVDGATTLQKIFHVLFPLMKPAVATVLIINFITCLNDLFTPLFFANRIQTLSVAITTLPSLDGFMIPWELVSAMGWIIIFPIIIFVSIFERQIMDGLMAGGVKS